MLTQIEIESLSHYISDKAVDGDESYKLWVKDLIEDWNDTRDISKFPYDTKDYVQMPRLKKTEDGRVIVDDYNGNLSQPNDPQIKTVPLKTTYILGDKMKTEKSPTPQEFFEAADLLQAKAEEMRGDRRGDLRQVRDTLATFLAPINDGEIRIDEFHSLESALTTLDSLIAEQDGKALVPIEPNDEMIGDGFLDQLSVVSRAFEKLENEQPAGDVKEAFSALYWIVTNGQFTEEQTEELTSAMQIVERAITDQQPVNKELLEALSIATNELEEHSQCEDCQVGVPLNTLNQCHGALIRAEQKGG